MSVNNGLRVYVVGGGVQYIQMFYNAGFLGARSVQDADLVCFTGGEDVSPRLYQEAALNTTNFNADRDDFEMDVFTLACCLEKPMVGICRGGQFLNVMNGGKMWQHVNGHAVASGHAILDVESGEWINGMTSTHHQMMIPDKDGFVVALAEEATYKQNASKVEEREIPETDDVEVVWYSNTRSLCFQPHPEYNEGNCRDYFLEVLNRYILTSIKDVK